MNSRDAEVPAGNEAALQQHLVTKGLTAPRVTPEMIDAEIVGEQSVVFPGTTVTVVLLHLRNGFTVTGESACASPENFDEAVGRAIARRNARDKIWSLLGFRLRDQLMAEQQA